MAVIKSARVIKMNQAVPKRYENINPIPIARGRLNDEPKCSINMPVMNAQPIYPMIKPPVGPNKMPSPPEKFEKTGAPVVPNKM